MPEQSFKQSGADGSAGTEHSSTSVWEKTLTVWLRQWCECLRMYSSKGMGLWVPQQGQHTMT